MTDAERAVHEAAANIPADVCARLETAPELNAEDRKTIIDIARDALARFQPKPDDTPEATAEPRATPGTQPKAGTEVTSKPVTAPRERS
jgi:F-type H+-transporting ATPase subunit alpha